MKFGVSDYSPFNVLDEIYKEKWDIRLSLVDHTIIDLMHLFNNVCTYLFGYLTIDKVFTTHHKEVLHTRFDQISLKILSPSCLEEPIPWKISSYTNDQVFNSIF